MKLLGAVLGLWDVWGSFLNIFFMMMMMSAACYYLMLPDAT